MKIIIGHAGKKPVGFDLDVLLITRLLIQANSGAGKSYLLRKLMEELFGHIQVIAIDPEGEFATLREKFDYVLVGKGGETPVHVSTAAEVATKLLELRASAVCDLYETPVRDRHTWVARFLEALINAPKKLWHPLIVIVDEAHLFCPEKGEGESEASGPMIDLATRGRKRGFCPVWATQRLAKLSKDAAAELQNKLIGGTFLDVDIKRAARDLGIAPGKDEREFAAHMKVIPPGTFIALGRAISKERLELQVGEVVTSHPKPGSSKHAAEPPAPSAKVKALLAALSDIPRVAEEKARTLEEYKKQILELRGELAAAKRGQSAGAAVDRRGLRLLQNRYSALKASVEELMKIAAKVTAAGFEGLAIKPEDVKTIFDQAAAQIAKIAERKIQQRNAEIDGLKKDLARVQLRLSSLLVDAPIEVNVDVEHREPFKVSESTIRHLRVDTPPGDAQISRAQYKILRALAEFQALGRMPVKKVPLAVFAGVSPNSGSYDNNLGSLRTNGFIDYPQKGFVTFTTAGRDRAPQVDAPTSPEEMLERCKSLLPLAQQKILDAAARAYPKAISKEAIAEAVGVSAGSGSFDNNVGRLRTLGILDYPAPRMVKLQTWVMLEDE
jgi:hypothetical protein